MIQRPRNIDVEAASASASIVVKVHQRLAEWLRCGLTLARIDTFVAEQLADLDAKSCFLGYRSGRLPPFPSHACLSPNDCIVHGTATFYVEPMREGDLLSIDIGVLHKGWIGDAAWTYAFGSRTEEAARLMDCGKETISRGVAQLTPGAPLIEFARAVQNCAEKEHGYHLTRGLGGHGYGKSLHAPPFISNVVPTSPVEWSDAFTKAQPGLLVAVEPMIAIGTAQMKQSAREWPIYTADGSLSVHYEHDVYVTEDGPLVLTEGLNELPDIVG